MASSIERILPKVCDYLEKGNKELFEAKSPRQRVMVHFQLLSGLMEADT